MDAIILAAGMGTRLWKGLWGVPKCLVRVRGQTILGRQIASLQAVGVKNIIIVVGYERKLIEDYVLSFHTGNFVFVNNDRYRETNTIYSLYLASKFINDDFFLLNGDVVFDAAILQRLVDTKKWNGLAIQIGTPDEEAVGVILDGMQILDIDKKLERAHGEFIGVSYWKYEMGRHLFNSVERICIDESRDNVFYETAINNMIERFYISAMNISPHKGIEIDTPEDLEKARTMYKLPYGGK